ncbi:unnamed protein product, partial [Schistosoma turkestanicum]
KITYIHHKRFKFKPNGSHKNVTNAFTATTTANVDSKTTRTAIINHNSTNHVIIKNSNLFIDEDDLAYATTIGLNTNMNSTDILSPSSYPLL